MAGTFRVGDVLIADVAAAERLQTGDVLVFASLAACDVIVHRVAARVSGGFITQGDALRLPDAALVTPQQVLGRVVRVQRGSRVLPVWGGWRGQVWASCVRLWHRLLAMGRLPYKLLKASGVVTYLWRPIVAQVHVVTDRGHVVKYLCAGKTVAIWRSADHFYWCRKPYDLVLKPPPH